MIAAYTGKLIMLKYLSLAAVGLVFVASPAVAQAFSHAVPLFNCSMNGRMDSYRDYWLRRRMHGDSGHKAEMRTPAPTADRYRNDLDKSTDTKETIIDSNGSQRIVSHN